MISTPYGLSVTTPLSPRVSRRAVSPAGGLVGSRVVGSSPKYNIVGGPTAYFAGSTLAGTNGTITSTGIPYVGGIQGVAGMPMSTGIASTNVIPSGPMRGQSRMEYIPYQRKYIDYESREYVDKVPVERTVIDYKEVKRIQYVPREKTVTDYYAIEHQVHYVPQTVPEKKIEYVPVETVTERIEYFPVEKQVVHYPEEGMTHSRRAGQTMIQGQIVTGSTIPAGYAVSRSPMYAGNGGYTTSTSYAPMTTTYTGGVQPVGEVMTTTINVSQPISMNNGVSAGMSGGYQSAGSGYATSERSISGGLSQTAQNGRPKSGYGSQNFTYQIYQPTTQNDYQLSGQQQKYSSETTATASGSSYPKSRIGAGQGYSTEQREEYQYGDRTNGIRLTANQFESHSTRQI